MLSKTLNLIYSYRLEALQLLIFSLLKLKKQLVMGRKQSQQNALRQS